MAALRRGWYTVEDGSKDRLLNVSNPAEANNRSKASLAGDAILASGLQEAERLIGGFATEVELPYTSREILPSSKRSIS